MKLHENNIPKIEPLTKTVDAIRTETPEDDFYFDPEKEITPEEWQEIMEVIQHLLNEDELRAYLSYAEDIILISPFYAEKLNLPRQINKIRYAFSDDIKSYKFGLRIPRILASIFICFPELRNEFKENFEEVRLTIAQERKLAQEAREKKNWQTYLFKALETIRFDPQNPSFLQLDNEEIVEIVKYLQELQNEDDVQHTARMIAKAFLSFPQLRNKIKLEKTMRLLRDKFEEARNTSTYSDFIPIAKYFMILSAESTEIDKDGQIKITPKPKPLETIEPLPQIPI